MRKIQHQLTTIIITTTKKSELALSKANLLLKMNKTYKIQSVETAARDVLNKYVDSPEKYNAKKQELWDAIRTENFHDEKVYSLYASAIGITGMLIYCMPNALF